MTRYSTTMSEILYNIREGYSPKEIKMAIGIATDKRYKGGNYTGAVNAIEKIKKGLSDHPQVKAVLKRVNESPEDMEPASPDEGGMATDQLEFMKYAAEQMMQHIQSGGEFPEWMQNKLSGTFEKMKSLYANIEHGEMKEGVEPIQWPSQPLEEELDLDEMKMDDPKLVKAFDKMKKGDTIKLKTSSTISQGKDFVDYVVKSKNVVNKGRVEKITLATKGNEGAVKKFLYKRDGKVTFAIGDMGASIDDIKEGTWALPDSPKAKAELKKLMSKPIKLGKEGDDASDKLYALIGDDELFDDLYVAGKKNPNGDARDIVKKHMKRLGIKEEVELEEKLKVSDGLGAWIDDFKKSDAPQFKGKSDEQKKKMAIAAFVDAGGKLEQKEETELDEAVKYQYVAIDRLGKVIGFASDERDAKDMASRGHTLDSPSKGKGVVGRNKAKVVKLKKPMSDKVGDMMINRDFDDKYGDKTVFSIGLGEEGELDEVMATWKVTVVKPVNKLKKGDSVSVKANNIPQALKKSAKAFGDSNLVAVPSTHFDVQKEETLVKEEEPQKPDTAKAVDQMRDDKKKTRIAQLQLQIAKASETINKLNAQEK